MKNMTATVEELEHTTSTSGAAAMETKLNDCTRLHSFLLEEMVIYADFLKDRLEKWDGLHTEMQDLTSWMDNAEERLEYLKGNEETDGPWLTAVKVGVVCSEESQNFMKRFFISLMYVSLSFPELCLNVTMAQN